MSFDSTLIELRDISCTKEKQPVFKNINLVIHEGPQPARFPY
jgi:ABC-type molybdenum transport system ATPase subunit/photorepair protein PhrA